jgi:cell division protein FtsN
VQDPLTPQFGGLTPNRVKTQTIKVPSDGPVSAVGGYVVQVSAQKTEDEARASYQMLQQKYSSVLGGHDPIIRRAELGQSGTWYRVHIGSFATSEQATAFCNNLQDAGGQCIVQKN